MRRCFSLLFLLLPGYLTCYLQTRAKIQIHALDNKIRVLQHFISKREYVRRWTPRADRALGWAWPAGALGRAWPAGALA